MAVKRQAKPLSTGFCLCGIGHWPWTPHMPTHTHINEHWLCEDHRENERQLWVEAYVCALQCMVEASVSQCWITEGGTKMPKVSSLVKTFLNTTGIECLHISSDSAGPHHVTKCLFKALKVKEKVSYVGWMKWQCDACQPLHGTNSCSHRLIKSFGMKKCCATTLAKSLTSELACQGSA